jgi:quercetin dioxygenase-like cupin family protein
MPFHRFEKLKSYHLNPHLSSTRGPIIEGQYMYFRRVSKTAGSRSKPHYHPNEFMAFFLEGKSHAMLGRRRRVAGPGMLVHIPSNARHSFKAIDDVNYLYVKDRTWTLIGSAADEALPDQAMSVTQVARSLKAGKYPGQRGTAERSQAIVDGLGDCFYQWIERLDAPAASGHHERWLEGDNLAFGLVESPAGHCIEDKRAPHEIFAYVISGTLDARVGREKRRARPGDVIHVPKGAARRWIVTGKAPARYAVVRSTPKLEAVVDRNGASDNWRG